MMCAAHIHFTLCLTGSPHNNNNLDLGDSSSTNVLMYRLE